MLVLLLQNRLFSHDIVLQPNVPLKYNEDFSRQENAWRCDCEMNLMDPVGNVVYN